MTDTPQVRICKAPLVELLRSIPEHHRIWIASQWAEDGTETGHRHIPIGRMAHDAASKIDALQAENKALRETNMNHELSLKIIGGTAKSNATLQAKLEAAERTISVIEVSLDKGWIEPDHIRSVVDQYKESQDESQDECHK